MLIRKLVDNLEQREIEVICNKRFIRIISGVDSGATIELADGSTVSASLLVGSDGIHSHIRESLFLEVENGCFGSITVGDPFLASKVNANEPNQWGIYVGSPGNVMIGSCVPGDTEWVMFIGKSYPDLGMGRLERAGQGQGQVTRTPYEG